MQAFLELGASLEESRCDLDRVHLGMSEPSDDGGEQRRITHTLGSIERRPSIGERGRNLGREQILEAAAGQDPCTTAVVIIGLGESFVEQGERSETIGPEGRAELEEQIGTLYT